MTHTVHTTVHERPAAGEPPPAGMFASLGRFVTARPGKVVLAWLVVVAGLTGISVALGLPGPSASQAAQLPARYESARAQQALNHAFGAPSTDATATLVVSRADGKPLTAANIAAADRAVGALSRKEAARHGVNTSTGLHPSSQPARVRVSPGVQSSPNRLIALAAVSFEGQVGTPNTNLAVSNIRADSGPLMARAGLRAHLTGMAAAAEDSSGTVALATYGMLAAIVVLLLVLFRSPAVAFTTVFAIYMVGAGVGALLNIGAHLFGFHLDDTETQLLPIVLFGVGTDYAVFLLYRYRERLRAGEDHKSAMAGAIARVGNAIIASALAVAFSFSALVVSGLRTFRVLGPSLAVAVLAMLFTSLTLLPAVLAWRGSKRARSTTWTRPAGGRTIGRVADLVAHRPVPVAVGAVAMLAVLGVSALHYHPSYDMQQYPSGSDSSRGYAEMQRGFPAGALYPTQVVVTARHAAPTAAQLAAFASDLGHVPGVGKVTLGPATDHGRVTVLDLALTSNPFSSTAFRTVHAIGQVAHARAPAGATALVGGNSAAYADTSTVVNHDMKVIFPLAGAAILLILLLMLRALLAPLYLIASVVTGFAATLGASVVAFQDIAGHRGLNFQLPIIVYLFVASIGTDYNILMISRLRDEIRAGLTQRVATATAIRQAGPAVAAAGVVLATSFALLMVSPALADIGFAVAAGVLISTFINAFLLVPALTTLAGRSAWWPSPGDAAPPQPGRPPAW
jgi:RND superfamily putative drug exporter